MNDSATQSGRVIIAGAPILSGGPHADAATRPFLASPLLTSAKSLTLATASTALARDRDGFVQSLGRLLAEEGRAVRLTAPARLPVSSVGRGGWRSVPLPHNVTRLDSVSVPNALVESDALVLVNALPSAAKRDALVLGVWSRFVPLKPRLGALASGPREGLAAEIALAFRPALIVLAGEVRGIAVAIATDDQVAAELFGLACAALTHGEEDPATATGPWEDALVQRATELGVGVSLPAEIGVRSVWTSRAVAGRDAFDDLVAELVTTLGIPNPIDRQESIG